MTRAKSVTKRALFLLSLCAVSALLLLLRGASLYAQNPDHVKQLLETRSCPGCDLRNTQLVGLNLNRADLTGADLGGAFLYRTTLHSAILTGAKFDSADLGGTDLRGARDANLTGARTDERTICPNGSHGPCN
jgi:uncharacterized protein YjbI with pentapeptide repeats